MIPNSINNQYAQAAYNLAQRHEAKRILTALADAGIQVIGLKGIVLKDDLYVSSEKRPMYDIDLLVQRSDIERAEDLLKELGYQFLSDGDYNLEFAREFMAELPYQKGGVIIELHWHLVSMHWNRRATHLNLDALWERAYQTELNGAPVLRLALEDEIVYLCYHLAVPHSLWHPSGIQDIFRLIQKNEDQFDWTKLVSRAKMWRVRIACWAALMRVQMSTGLNIPEHVLAAFRVPKWRQKLLLDVMRSAEQAGTVLVSDQKRFLGVLLVDNLISLPAVLLGGIFPGRHWLKARYNLSNREAFWRQFTYPVEVVYQAIKAIRNI